MSTHNKRLSTSQTLSQNAITKRFEEMARKRIKDDEEREQTENTNDDQICNGEMYFDDGNEGDEENIEEDNDFNGNGNGDGDNNHDDEDFDNQDGNDSNGSEEDYSDDGFEPQKPFIPERLRENDLDYDSEDFDQIKESMVADFNIMDEIKKTYCNHDNFAEKNATAGAQPLSPSSSMSTADFFSEFEAICSAGGVDLKYQNSLLSFIQRAFPDANISKGGDRAFKPIENIIPPSKHLIKVNVCANDCSVFLKEDDIKCKNPSCEGPRFTADNRKYPVKNLYYRSMTSIILDLLNQPMFLSLLRYEYRKPANKPDYENMEIMDGANSVRHMAAMHRRFEKKMEAGSTVIEVSLLISLFYDGIQLYRKKQVNYWPLLFTILNLPPALRTRVGAGMFMLTAFYGRMDSPTENFLFDKCLINELMFLRQGITLEVGTETYFLQVRCIAHVLDTKAVGKQLKVQECASHSGCPLCHSMIGVSRKELSKSIYHNHRRGLDPYHYCRMFGHSQQCCPPVNRDQFLHHDDYMAYLNGFGKAREETEEDKHAVAKIVKMRGNNTFGVQAPRQLCLTTEIRVCSTTFDLKHFQNCLKSGEVKATWYHYDNSLPEDFLKQVYHPDRFKNVLWFPDLDYCPQISFARRTKASCINDGEIAEGMNANLPKYNSSKVKKRHSHGFKGRWSFTRLGYTNHEFDTFFDPGHSNSGIAVSLLNILKYGTTQKHAFKMFQSFKNNNTHHPYGHAKGTGTFPWRIMPKGQATLDEQINCILIPSGYSAHYQIKNVFSETGNLRSKAKIMIFTVLIDYINLFIQIPNGYKTFLSMLGSDFREMMRSQFDNKSIELLRLKVLETVSVFEGLFGDAECVILYHELIHIPEQILHLGPVDGWWTFSGEKALHFVKEHKLQGGQSFDKTLISRYDKSETASVSEFYTSVKSKISKFGLVMRNGKIIHRTHYIELSRRIYDRNVTYSSFEMGKYLYALYRSVLVQCDNDEDLALRNSPYYRLCCAYTSHTQEGFIRKDKVTLYMFMFLLAHIHKKTEPTLQGGLLHYFKNLRDGFFTKASDKIRICVEDFAVAAKILDFKDYSYYNKVDFNGEVFQARGFEYVERKAPISISAYGAQTMVFAMHNGNNILKENYGRKSDYSSWCKYRKGKQLKCAQLNYYFRVDIPSDKG